MPARSTKKIQRKKVTRKANKRVNPHLTKIIVSVLALFISITILGGYIFYNKVNKQFASAESASSIDQSYTSVLFVVADDFSKGNPSIRQLEYKIFDHENKKIVTYEVDSSFTLQPNGNFGEEPVSKLLALGALNQENPILGGIDFVNSAIFKLFAFPVDRYVFVDDVNSWTWEGLFNQGQFMYVLGSALGGQSSGVYTNMQLDELYRMSKFVSGLPEDRKSILDIEKSSEQVISDSFREITIGSKLAQEGQSIAVLNASGQVGVASFGAAVVANLGGRVVSVDNAENKFSESFIVSDDPEAYSVNLLSKVFGISKVISKESAKQYVTDSQLYRSDVLIILGE